MPGRMKGIEGHRSQQTVEAQEKAGSAIMELKIAGKAVNFSSVSSKSGVSKSFLYGDAPLRDQIEQQRAYEIDKEMNQRARNDKTSKAKDVIIAAKDRRIAKLEEENKKLRRENECLRGRLYDMK